MKILDDKILAHTKCKSFLGISLKEEKGAQYYYCNKCQKLIPFIETIYLEERKLR